jgi:hypothetical protein
VSLPPFFFSDKDKNMNNNMPPSNIDPSDLWSQIIALPRAHRIVDTPLTLNGVSVPIAMWVLTGDESDLCAIEAEKYARKMLKDNIPGKNEVAEGYETLYNRKATVELLFRACRRVNDLSKPFFPSVAAISKSLTTDQISVLMKTYLIIQQEIGPIIARMSQNEFDAWVETIAKGGISHFLGSTTSGAQIQFITSLACQLHSLQTGTSLLTMPAEELTENE